MTITAFIHGGGAPGTSTMVAALATHWPRAVLAVDADPHVGTLLPGWLSRWWAQGKTLVDGTVVAFAHSTRRLPSVPAEGLVGHLNVVPLAEHVRVLGGLNHPEQALSVGEAGWQRLASALRDLTAESGPDVFCDVGRWSAHTPWPLLEEADLVLVGVRPTLRHVHAATPLVNALLDRLPARRIAAAVSASTRVQATDTAAALELTAAVDVPDDPAGAALFSDGEPLDRRPQRCPLLRASRRAAHRLHARQQPYARFTTACTNHEPSGDVHEQSPAQEGPQ